MVLYGVLVKTRRSAAPTASTSPRPTLLGQQARRRRRRLRPLRARGRRHRRSPPVATAVHVRSVRGLVTQAVRGNELRVEYLGGSVRAVMAIELRACRRARRRSAARSTVHGARPHRADLHLLDHLRRVRLRRHPRRPPQRRGGLRRLTGARARALVLEPLLPEHLAARARPLPARHDPVPAARHRLALGAPPPAGRPRRGAGRRRAPRGAAE